MSALVSTNRPHRLEHVLRTLGGQRDVDLQVVLLAHGWQPPADVADRARDLGVGDLVLLDAPAEVPLGDCLNRLVAAADGDVVAKVDDDDHYGPHYLADQVHALGWSGAEVVGKQAHHMYLEGQDVTILRFPDREHRWTDLVMGPTIVTARDVALRHPFPAVGRGEDTGFLRDVVAAGGRVYSADRFSFLQMRHTSGLHTWEASAAELLAGSRVVGYGLLESHVDV